MTDKTYTDWRNDLKPEKESVSYAMSDIQVDTVKQQVRGILGKIRPV